MKKQKVLVATMAGGHPACIGIESLIGVALALRGAEVHFLLCDGVLPTCLQCSADQFPEVKQFLAEGPKTSLCDGCYGLGCTAFEPTTLPIRKLSHYITDADRDAARQRAADLTLEDLPRLKDDGVGIGEHVMAGSLRFFATGDLATEECGLEIGRKFVEAAYLSKLAAERLFDQEKYDSVFLNHGIYVPHGLIKEVAEKRGSRTSVWWLAAKEKSLHLNHKDTGVYTMLDEPISFWENMRWSEAAETELMDYLASRWTGCRDWVYHGMHEGSQADVKALSDEFKIDFNRPTIGMLTNVIWDAALFYPANVFPSQVDWIIETIKYFAARPEMNLIIRVHPAEVKDTMASRQTAVGEIEKAFPQLPDNVFVIPAESRANTYALLSQCDAAIIYGTTTGMELTSMGIPTITAGQAFIKNKGITIDPKTPDEYFSVLENLPFGQRMPAEQIRRARMYAYNYYFRRSIPVRAAVPIKGWPPIKIDVPSLHSLMPGEDLGLDVICNGVLYETEFLYPAEEIALNRVSPGSARLPEHLSQPMCESGGAGCTAIVTMNKSIRTAQTLDLTVRSILNEAKFEPLVKELTSHLRSSGNDDTYLQVYAASRDYLADQLPRADAQQKPLLLAALNRVHTHFVHATESESAYDPSTKPNPQAVFYPNPKYGKPLYDELPYVKNVALVTQESKLLVAGKAVMPEVAQNLSQRRISWVWPFEHEPIADSAYMRQLIDLAFGIKRYPSILNTKPGSNGGQYIDPLRPHIIYGSEAEYRLGTERYLSALRADLLKADVCMLSLESIEIWRLSIDGTVLPGFPDTLPPYLVQQQILGVKENLEELQRMLNTWRSFNPRLKLIIGISPLPLPFTARSDQHVITATAHGKATLRVAIDQLVRATAGLVYYFPIYEACMYATANPLKADARSLSDCARDKALRLFDAMFVDPALDSVLPAGLPQPIRAL
ncbi:MAG: GSCFA domain-containing protein [Candidatus Obscuribacterales bacterium]